MKARQRKYAWCACTVCGHEAWLERTHWGSVCPRSCWTWTGHSLGQMRPREAA